jgi:hypothetical protein
MSEWRDYSQPAAPDPASLTAEERRLQEARAGVPWRAWGPYLSERQWGTVREDYSDNGDAWSYFSHDQARSRAYRWGEDGIAGISDDKQRLCLAVALWNERDPILKERLFGLTNAEGNHGEDVKEGGRHGLDGDVQPEHAQAGPGPAGTGWDLRGIRAQVRRAFLLDRGRRGPDRRAPR